MADLQKFLNTARPGGDKNNSEIDYFDNSYLANICPDIEYLLEIIIIDIFTKEIDKQINLKDLMKVIINNKNKKKYKIAKKIKFAGIGNIEDIRNSLKVGINFVREFAKDLEIKIIFIFADLFYRTFINDNNTIRIVTCIMIAYELIYNTPYTKYFSSILLRNNIEEDIINNEMLIIFEQSEGYIYNDSYYKICNDKKDIIKIITKVILNKISPMYYFDYVYIDENKKQTDIKNINKLLVKNIYTKDIYAKEDNGESETSFI